MRSGCPVFTGARRSRLAVPFDDVFGELLDRRPVALDVTGAHALQLHPAVTQSRGAALGGVGFTTAENRHRRLGMRFDHHLGDPVVLATPGHPAAAPQRAQRRDHLVKSFAPSGTRPSDTADAVATCFATSSVVARGDVDGVGEPQTFGHRAIAPMSTQESGQAVSGAHIGLPVGESG